MWKKSSPELLPVTRSSASVTLSLFTGPAVMSGRRVKAVERKAEKKKEKEEGTEAWKREIKQ